MDKQKITNIRNKTKGLINPHIPFNRSYREFALGKRMEKKRTFYDFGALVYYIVPEIIDTDKFYGEHKLNYNEYFDFVVKISEDEFDDKVLQYAKFGLEFPVDIFIQFSINQDMFQDLVINPLTHLDKIQLERNSPRSGDLIYFTGMGLQDSPEEDMYFHFTHIFEITNVTQGKGQLPFKKMYNWDCIAKPWKKSDVDNINLPDDIEEEMNLEVKLDKDKILEEFSDNNNLDNDKEVINLENDLEL